MASAEQEALVKAAVAAALARIDTAGGGAFSAPVGVSGRHAHLSAGDFATLFGAGAALSPARPLKQPGQFAATEVVAVVGPAASLAGVRIVGPVRDATVVELLASDLRRLGIAADVRAGERFAVVLSGPAGVLRLPAAGVVSPRHLHAAPADAKAYGLEDGGTVAARLGAPGRRVTFHDVRVRVREDMALELHIDRDEADACGARTGDEAEIIFGAARGVRRPARAPATRKALLTEADVVAAHRAGETPNVAGVLLTPYAKDALRRYFPELLSD